MKVLLCNDDLPLTGAAVWPQHTMTAALTMIRKERSRLRLPNNNCVYRALEHLLMRLSNNCLSGDLTLIASSCQPKQWPLVGAGPRTGGRREKRC